MLLNSAAHFMTINKKAVSVTRQLVPKTSHTQGYHISFVWQQRHLDVIEEHVYRCHNNIGLLKTKKCKKQIISVILSLFHNAIVSFKHCSHSSRHKHNV